MDTRFWGPSGWRLLHLITFTYDPKSQKDSVKEMFEMLPFVLPCKFCRSSLTEYYEKEPLSPALESKEKLSKWLYKIHNHVNDKLRKQHLCNDPNPSFESVKKVYHERIAAGCIKVEFEGWDFLFSIAENHPFSSSSRNSSPMPDSPKEFLSNPSLNSSEKNRWNILSPEDRFPFYTRFWKSIGSSLPFESWRHSWLDSHPRLERVGNPRQWKKELWRIRCFLEKVLYLNNLEEFESVCKKLQNHTSGCNTSKRSKTCRMKKKYKHSFIQKYKKTRKYAKR